LYCNNSSWQNVLLVVIEPLFVTETEINLTAEIRIEIEMKAPLLN